MKKFFIVLSLIFIQQPAFADIYPGDTAYTNIVQRVYHEVSSDSIDMLYKTNIVSRNQLCSELVNRHNNHKAPGVSQTNSAFIGVTITQLDCLNALWFSDGYNSSAGWTAWAGNLVGTWFNDDNQQFTDPANWNSPVKENGNDGRVYDFQSVVFSGRSGNARYGWNMSNPNVAYVWGWDGKDNSNQNGERGTHVGWTFQKSGAECIIWATPEEAFLECIKPKCTGKQRVSTGFFGMGQWTVGSTSCSTGWGSIRPITPFKYFNIR